MIFRLITSDGDWCYGKGRNDYATAEAAINLNILTRLKSWVGDCFFALLDGIDWRSRLDTGQQKALVDEIKSNLLQAFGVVGINSVEAIFDGETRVIRITYNIQTIYSPSFQGTIVQGSGTGA
jgi:hypothetical protein